VIVVIHVRRPRNWWLHLSNIGLKRAHYRGSPRSRVAARADAVIEYPFASVHESGSGALSGRGSQTRKRCAVVKVGDRRNSGSFERGDHKTSALQPKHNPVHTCCIGMSADAATVGNERLPSSLFPAALRMCSGRSST
jgi:hypothetical protein